MTHNRTGRRALRAPDIADVLAREAHALRCAVQDGADAPDPADLYAIVGDLTHVAYRLQQAYEGIGRCLVGACANGRLRTDDGSDPARRIAEIHAALRKASGYAHSLDVALGAAWGLLGTVAACEPDDARTDR